MAFLTWTPAYSVGVDAFDREHVRLMEMINALHDGMHTGKAKAALDKVMEELISYTVHHFEHEERELLKHGYPQLRAHKEQHKELRAHVMEFRNRLTLGFNGAVAIEMSRFLRAWLLRHIQDEDREYGRFLNAKGIY